MSKTRSNLITIGYSGLTGDQFVLKNYGTYSVIAKKPVFNKPWSQKQIEHRRNFGMASRMAKARRKDPDIRNVYEKKKKPGVNAFNLILKDVYFGKEVTNPLKKPGNIKIR